MPNGKVDPTLVSQIEELKDGRIRQISPDEVVKVVETIIAGINSDGGGAEMTVRSDLEDLSDFIQATKAEIMILRPEEIPDDQLPVAAEELDAIVRATEEATNNIMEATELVEQIADSLEGTHAEILTNATTMIYEACGFQDITGQRISKVINALQEIEHKVEALIAAFGDADTEAREARRLQRRQERENSLEEVADDGALLQGPQLPESASSQDDIDALFASLD